MHSVWRDETLTQRFGQLTALLKAGEAFWRHHAFKYLQLPWEVEHRELSHQLRALSLAEAAQLARNDALLFDFLSPHSSLFARIGELCALGEYEQTPLPDIEPRAIPGRKWQQIRYFAPCVPSNDFVVLEWCAGKSHLGRTLARQQHCTVIALDYDAQLIDAGRKLAAGERVAIRFDCVDVMTAAAASILQRNHNAIALHACGDLHVRLLQLCAQQSTATLTLAPCCYHLMRDESRYVLSQAAIASGLWLQRDDLRTAVHGTVTASALENRRRQQLQAWRLGFDQLQRELRGCDDYLPTPSLSVALLKDGFTAFCGRLAQLRNISLPNHIDCTRYEHVGNERLREVTALDLPRLAFRRVLELWLALDRAQFLLEHGYIVEVGVFCGQALTPRNILIRAQRDSRAALTPLN